MEKTKDDNREVILKVKERVNEVKNRKKKKINYYERKIVGKTQT